ncbi:MAG: uracil-DNA glycosylase [Thermodesulfobacteriota bacterium]|nr:uracil-DNA glycosylase [Thermodesulfobacteriota bacterium]
MKGILEAHRDMGLDLPPISNHHLDSLQAKTQDTGASRGGLDDVASLEELRSFMGECRRCKLHEGRSHLVFGEGSPRSEMVFVGEGPGRDEDIVGRPFVGEAGRLLTRIIRAMGLSREDVYICNVVKCRPPKNRDPEKDEIEACIPFLKRQLAIIRPGIICALGRIAGQSLLGENFKITEKCGKWHSYMGIPVMPTYHPAYLLRNPSAKRQVWEDVQKIMRRLGLEVKRNG